MSIEARYCLPPRPLTNLGISNFSLEKIYTGTCIRLPLIHQTCNHCTPTIDINLSINKLNRIILLNIVIDELG